MSSVTCGRLKSESFSASVALPSGAVREDESLRLLAGGRQYAGRDKRSVLHALPLGYRLDDNGGIREPHGMCGERLAVDLHAVTADEVAMRNVMLCVERCHLAVREPGRGALRQRARGDHARRGQARRGLHRFRRRHHHALGVRRRPFHPCRCHRPWRQRHHHRHRPHPRAPLDYAERLKTLHGSAFATLSDEREIITYPAVTGMPQPSLNQITKAQLAVIIRPRIEEILDLMRRRLALGGSPPRSRSSSC